MPTVDFRTRHEGDTRPLDLATFLAEQVPALPDDWRLAAGRAATRLGLHSLTLLVEDDALTFAIEDDDRLVVRSGQGGPLTVELDREAFSDLVQEVASTFWLR